jgi:hypothetical protein
VSAGDVAIVQAAEDAGRAEVDAKEEADTGPVLNAWYWVKPPKETGKKRGRSELGCVTHIGSNYALISYVGRHSPTSRIHLERFPERCEREPDPKTYIDRQVGLHRDHVRELMGEVRDLTQRLGVGASVGLPAGAAETAALSTASADLGAYKTALIKAMEKTLPDLFKQIAEANELMAVWMMAEVLPVKAEATVLERSIKTIETRVGNVELYAGLTEDIELIADGEPAAVDEPVRLFQRRCYMDEECLAAYEAGGMDYQSVGEFAAWLAKPANRDCILPFPRCVVAFRIRRHEKERHADSLAGFIAIANEAKADRKTFLFIRNGERVYMLATAIEFDEKLFPDIENQKLHGKLWVEDPRYGIKTIITDDRYQGLLEDYVRDKAAWDATPKSEKRKNPWDSAPQSPEGHWTEYDRRTVYYDDIEARIQSDMAKHNRLVLVLQGLLDRSLVLHPHPPYKLWTPEGFAAALRPIYEDAHGITSGAAPEWRVYREQLAKSIRPGTVVIGQHRAWLEAEAEKENDRRDRRGRSSSGRDLETYQPYGNPGPGLLARVVSMSRDRKTATFEWMRKRQTGRWVPNPKKPGWRMWVVDGELKTRFTCPVEILFNVDAYQSGDFHLFFDDPRTRADYLQWARFLLAAEDYKAGKRKVRTDELDEDEDDPDTGPIKADDDSDASADTDESDDGNILDEDNED